MIKRKRRVKPRPYWSKTERGEGKTGRKKLDSPAEYQTLKMIQPETKKWRISQNRQYMFTVVIFLIRLQIKLLISFNKTCLSFSWNTVCKQPCIQQALRLYLLCAGDTSPLSACISSDCLSATRTGSRLISVEKINTVVCFGFFSCRCGWNLCLRDTSRHSRASPHCTTREKNPKKHYLVILCPLAHTVMQEHLILVCATLLQARPIITL